MNLQRGFSLLEMAIVLLILGLLIGGLIQPLTTQLEISRTTDTQTRINTIQEALYGFLIANGRLPCPATLTSPVAAHGFEDPLIPSGTGLCTAPTSGFVPGRQLGLAPLDVNGLVLDAWNNPIRYAVSPTISGGNSVVTLADGIRTTTLATFSPLTHLYICASATGITATTCGPTANSLTSNAVAIIYSTGKNGATGGTGIDEAQNPNSNGGSADLFFVSHPRSEAGAVNGEYDDILTWIPSNILISKLMAAGWLP